MDVNKDNIYLSQMRMRELDLKIESLSKEANNYGMFIDYDVNIRTLNEREVEAGYSINLSDGFKEALKEELLLQRGILEKERKSVAEDLKNYYKSIADGVEE